MGSQALMVSSAPILLPLIPLRCMMQSHFFNVRSDWLGLAGKNAKQASMVFIEPAWWTSGSWCSDSIVIAKQDKLLQLISSWSSKALVLVYARYTNAALQPVL